MMNNNTAIRIVKNEEMDSAYGVMKQLRVAHTLESFKTQVYSQLRSGYQLFGAFKNERLLGLVGARPVMTLARGFFLHVDDLVVDDSARGEDIGRNLMDFIHDYARNQGMKLVFLDARPQAIGFYEKIGYTNHSSRSMKISLQELRAYK